MTIRWIFASLIALGLFFGLNFGWTHAALASLVTTDSKCSSELETGARRRVAELFGDVRATPRFVCLNEPRLGLNVSHGTARFAPFLPTVIVLGPNGHVTDVAAHEFAHAEIAVRTSALLRTYVLPTWFDEGLAMQLDKRSDYSFASLAEHIQTGRLDGTGLADLRWPSGFFRNDEKGKAHYAFAKCVVGRWMQRADKSNLNATLATVTWWHTSQPCNSPMMKHFASSRQAKSPTSGCLCQAHREPTK